MDHRGRTQLLPCNPLFIPSPSRIVRGILACFLLTGFYSFTQAQTKPGRKIIVNESCVRIKAYHSYKYLAVEGDGHGNGKNIHQWAEQDIDHFEWKIEHLGNKEHRIVNKRSGKVMDVQGFGETPGSNVHQWEWHGEDNQRWYIREVNRNTILIQSKHNGLYLDIAGVSEQNGANLIVWDYNGQKNQHFWLKRDACSSCDNLEPLPFASFTGSSGWTQTDFVTVKEGDQVSISGWSSPRGYASPACNWSWEGPNGFRAHHRTALISNSIKVSQAGVYTATVSYRNCSKTIKIKVRVEEGARPDAESKLVYMDKTCVQIQNVNSALFLAPAARGIANDENIQQWEKNNNPLLDWEIEYLGNKEHRIIHKSSGKVLDVSGSGTDPGTNVHLWDWHGRDNQRWYLVQAEKDDEDEDDEDDEDDDDDDEDDEDDDEYSAYYLRSKHSGLYLEISQGSKRNGGNAVVWTFHEGPSQAFKIRTDQCDSHTQPCEAKITKVEFNSLSGGADVKLEDGATYSPHALPKEYNIEAIVEKGGESVAFELQGPTHISHVENKSPYRLAGDHHPLELKPGKYQLSIQVYSENQGKGELCAKIELGFELENLAKKRTGGFSAGTLVPIQQGPFFICKLPREFHISAENEGLVVPNGFEAIYILTDSDDLIVHDINREEPAFVLFKPNAGKCRIHTLVYDPKVFDLSFIEIDKTTGFDVLEQAKAQGASIDLDVDGALYELLDCSSIAGSAFEDVSRNGLFEEGEPLTSGVVVSLLDGNMAELASTLTDGHGNYRFNDLLEGNYFIQFFAPGGFSFTQKDAGDDNKDSDADPISGFTDELIVGQSEELGSVDVGLIRNDDCAADAGTITSLLDSTLRVCDLGESFTLTAEASGQVLPDENYFVFYLLSEGEDLVVSQIDNQPEFTISPRVSTFRIHTLVANLNPDSPDFFNLSGIIFQVTTISDILSSIQEAQICASIDAEGAFYDIVECSSAASSGNLISASSPLSEEDMNRLQIKAMPNPATYLLSLKLTPALGEELKPYEVYVYNMAGQRVLFQESEAARLGLDVSRYPEGLYLVQVIQGDLVWNQKFLKQ